MIMNCKFKITVPLEVGMELTTTSMLRDETVCRKILVSAIGQESFLAMATDGEEHQFRSLDDYEYTGFRSREISELGEKLKKWYNEHQPHVGG